MQLLAFFFLWGAMVPSSTLVYPLALLINKPRVVCYAPSGLQIACSVEDICGEHPGIKRWHVDWSDVHSIKNYVIDLDMLCESDMALGALGSCYFIGALVGLIGLFKLSSASRLLLAKVTSVLAAVCMTGIVVAHQSINMLFLFYGALGVVCSLNVCIILPYMLELTPDEYKVRQGTLIWAFHRLLPIFFIPYLVWVSKEWLAFQLAPLFVTFFLVYFAFRWMPQSPVLLYRQGKY